MRDDCGPGSEYCNVEFDSPLGGSYHLGNEPAYIEYCPYHLDGPKLLKALESAHQLITDVEFGNQSNDPADPLCPFYACHGDVHAHTDDCHFPRVMKMVEDAINLAETPIWKRESSEQDEVSR